MNQYEQIELDASRFISDRIAVGGTMRASEVYDFIVQQNPNLDIEISRYVARNVLMQIEFPLREYCQAQVNALDAMLDRRFGAKEAAGLHELQKHAQQQGFDFGP